MPFKLSDYATYKPREAVEVGMTEKLIEEVPVFNAASGGAIQLQSKLITQEIVPQTFLKVGANAVADRDPNNVTGDFPLVDVAVSGTEAYKVFKLVKGIQSTNAGLKDFYEKNYASGMTKDYLTKILDDGYANFQGLGSNHQININDNIKQTAIASLVGAISSQSSLIVSDGTLASPLTKANVNPTLFTKLELIYGAHRNLLKCYVMRSESVALLRDDVILQKRIIPVQFSQGTFGVGMVYTFSDKMVIEIDDPSLQSLETIGGAANTKVNKILALREDASIACMDDLNVDEVSVQKGHNFIKTIAATYDTSYKVRGFNLKSTVSSLYTAAKFGAKANWQKNVTQDLDCAGCLVHHRIA